MSNDQVETKRWSLPHRIAFRFVFVYLILFILPCPLGWLPGTESLAKPYTDLWDSVVPWVGSHVLRLSQDIGVEQNGSGDRTYDYVQVVCFVVLAAVATVIWSLVGARREEHSKLHAGLRLYLRYAVSVMMISYGFAKVFKTQFPFPGPSWLLQTYGDASPMRLLWAFMGYSTPYNVFTGGAEVLGGLLLLFRRTTALGALVIVAVMANVVMLNFCYDVPVKLASLHLVLMALFLLLPDLRRLANLFLLNRPTQPMALRTPFDARWMERSRSVLKVTFVGYVLVSSALGQMDQREQMAYSTGSPFAGAYEVEAFVKGGATLPPLTTDAVRWRTVCIFVFPDGMRMAVTRMNGEPLGFQAQDDPDKSTLALSGASDEKNLMAYSRPDPEHLVLTGSYMNDTLTVTLRKIDESKYLLVNRGFRWINEMPYNR